MIPRMLPIPDETRYALRDKDAWAAAAIAALHRQDEMRETGFWSCRCRCCLWVMENTDEGLV